MLAQGFDELLGWASFGLFIAALLAFVDAVLRREDAYRAAGKQNKVFWLIILGLTAVVSWLFNNILGILQIAGLIATIVYIVDVRPALKQVSGGGGWGRRGGRRPGGSSSDGPYGPFNGRR
ncbi:DUF2516 family protein [Streptomyces sp. TP-A0874]|uniref:DUF2516 family protein n=1 Tax=Streptomyces sp. TP-A0874 TaxID=549819 RepID=UPI00099FFD2F|nr:DUF2516 family protein [Streptomyces sp. TP-A0874]